MNFNAAILPQGYAPQAFTGGLGFNSTMGNLGGMSTMMLQLQQQLMMITSSLLGSLNPSGFQGAQAGSGFAPVANFGHGFGGGLSGLGNFLGQGFPGLGSSISRGRGQRSNKNPGANRAPQSARDSKFTTLNVNIKSRPAMSQNKVLHDVRKAGKNADLIGWNEISLDRYRDAIKSLGPEWGHFMPRDGKYKISNPISYRKDEWKMLQGGFEKTHEGKAGICPARYITWARLKHKGTGEKVVRINTHLVSGAFNKSSSQNAWRRSSWNQHMNKLSSLVSKFKGQGYKVIVSGDFNKDSSKVLGNQVAYDNKLNVGTHDGGSTLDYMMHGQNKGLQNLKGGVLGGFHSDHNAVFGTYNLGRRPSGS